MSPRRGELRGRRSRSHIEPGSPRLKSSHLFVGVADFDRAMAFYEPLLATLGLVLRFRDDARPWAGWQAPDVPRPLHEHYDGAYFRDPAGNMLCVACHVRLE